MLTYPTDASFVTPQDLVRAAELLAQQLLGLPEEQKGAELRAIKAESPVLHAMVEQKLTTVNATRCTCERGRATGYLECTCAPLIGLLSPIRFDLLFPPRPRTEDVMEKRGIVDESTPTDRPVDERCGEKTAADAREDHPATRLSEAIAAELRAKTAACMRAAIAEACGKGDERS